MDQICVLMSSYNGESYIRQQIDSILRQKNCRVHLHVRDDGSTDGTRAILKEYEKNGRLTLHTGPNLGPALSFLQLLKETKGYPWYAFADQDDLWYDTKLSDGIRRLTGQSGPALCYSNAALIDAHGASMGVQVYRAHHPKYKHTIACVGALLGCTMVFNEALAACIQEHELPARSRIRMHDYYLAQVCLACGGHIAYDGRICMGYRQHGSNVVGMKSGKWDALKQRVRDILTTRTPSVADHGEEICRIYGPCMSEENRQLFHQIASYKDSMKNRFRLYKRFDGRDVSPSMRLKYRAMILLGKL